MSNGREFDIVVYGASGFTGRLVAEYLHQQYGADGDVKWAMAGRSEEKLKAVREEIGVPDSVPLIDRIAPEHLALTVADPDALAKDVRNAGAIFLGRYTPEAIGDQPLHPLARKPGRLGQRLVEPTWGGDDTRQSVRSC